MAFFISFAETINVQGNARNIKKGHRYARFPY